MSHVLFECPKYDVFRQRYIDRFIDSSLSTEERLSIFVNMEDPRALNNFRNFIVKYQKASNVNVNVNVNVAAAQLPVIIQININNNNNNG